MTADRYTVVEGVDGHYLHDGRNDELIPEPYQTAFEAHLAATRLNLRPQLQENLIEALRRERLRQDRDDDAILDSSQHLAIAMKKLGDAASTLNCRQPRERNVEQELVELGAVVLRWLEQIDQTR